MASHPIVLTCVLFAIAAVCVLGVAEVRSRRNGKMVRWVGPVLLLLILGLAASVAWQITGEVLE